MRLIPDGHPVRRYTRSVAGAMEGVSALATLAATLALAYAARRLIQSAEGHFDMGGGWAFVEYARQHVGSAEGIKGMLPGLHLRAMWWTYAWVEGVFGAGCLVLAVAGARNLFWRLQGLVRAA